MGRDKKGIKMFLNLLPTLLLMLTLVSIVLFMIPEETLVKNMGEGSGATVFCTTDHLKARIMKLETRTTIPPCKMDNDVLFYVFKGEGTITVDNETSGFGIGDCIVVPHQDVSRSIHAKIDMEILAVQGLK